MTRPDLRPQHVIDAGRGTAREDDEMTDHPIVFSGPMVCALLEGRKTQTRRVLDGKVNSHGRLEWPAFVGGRRSGSMCHPPRIGAGPNGACLSPVSCAPGDRLWVREAWRAKDTCDDVPPRDMGDQMPIRWEADGALSQPNARYWIAGEQRHVSVTYGRHRAGRHMPRWASRLTLTVTDVRVQRLQEISLGDADREGWPGALNTQGWTALPWFRDLWDSLHGPDAWAANPWVAAYTFTVQRGNIDSIGAAS